jgi:hypothetical protein
MSQLSAFGILPLRPHSSHGGGYILRPGSTGCPTARNPVPSQAGHICSVGFATRLFTRTFHVARRPARPHLMAGNLAGAMSHVQRANALTERNTGVDHARRNPTASRGSLRDNHRNGALTGRPVAAAVPCPTLRMLSVRACLASAAFRVSLDRVRHLRASAAPQ